MPYTAKAVANEFLEVAKRDGESLSAMKLQKLVYFAHGWHLALVDKPLFRESIEAWQFGPVVPELYHTFKRFGSDPVTEEAGEYVFSGGTFRRHIPRVENSDDGEARKCALDVIKRVWSVYAPYNAVKLSNATHLPGTPWYQVYKPGERHLVIPNDIIKDYFKSMIANGNR